MKLAAGLWVCHTCLGTGAGQAGSFLGLWFYQAERVNTGKVRGYEGDSQCFPQGREDKESRKAMTVLQAEDLLDLRVLKTGRTSRRSGCGVHVRNGGSGRNEETINCAMPGQ